MKMKSWIWTALVLGISTPADPCTIVRPVSPEDVVRNADAIVRAAAVGYAVPPQNGTPHTTGEPDSRVRFKIAEVIKGTDVPSTINLPGYLVDRDDFNEGKIPHTFVRPEGRLGSCFANSYRIGAEFLLMLKQRDGAYTVNWYALGPVNEQLRSADDPWLVWVREQTRRIGLDVALLMRSTSQSREIPQ
jgi:hypothetical protein